MDLINEQKEFLNNLLKDYVSATREGNKNKLKKIRRRCIITYVKEHKKGGNTKYIEKILDIAFDCHRMMQYINITGAKEFLNIKENEELKDPVYNVGLLDETIDGSESKQ